MNPVSLVLIVLIHLKTCKFDDEVEDKLLRGTPCSTDDYPYMVQVYNGIGARSSCTGVAIDKRFVLTAASCVHMKKNFKLIYFRTTTWTKVGRDTSGEVVDANCMAHESYSRRPTDVLYDIALCAANAAVKNIRPPLRVPKNFREDYNVKCKNKLDVKGWGKPATTKSLECATNMRLTQDLCKESNTMLCTELDRKSATSPTGGDVGAALMCGKWLIGIGSEKRPGHSKVGYWTKVHTYTDWIAQKMKSNRPREASNSNVPQLCWGLIFWMVVCYVCY